MTWKFWKKEEPTHSTKMFMVAEGEIASVKLSSTSLPHLAALVSLLLKLEAESTHEEPPKES